MLKETLLPIHVLCQLFDGQQDGACCMMLTRCLHVELLVASCVAYCLTAVERVLPFAGRGSTQHAVVSIASSP
jgi:hypothetical protein